MLNTRASNCRTLATTPVSLVRTLASSHSLKNQPKSHTFWQLRNRKSLQRKRRTFAFEPLSAVSDVVPSIPTSSPTCYPKYHRLLPCPSENGPPRVEHLVVLVGGPVLEYISKTLDLPPMYVADLIHFGAVYYALVCPDPPPTATAEEFRIYKEATAPAVLRKRSSIKGKTIREAQKTYRITHVNEFVEAGTYLRVHVHPKRFPRCYEIDWRSRIVAVSESYVVLDKPAGTSVGGTTDNIEESCATFATRALGFAEPLKTTHQIDNCTEGCVVLARTKEYCSVFHGKIREKKVNKLYLALAAAPVPVGIITHYMRPINMAPRLISEVLVRLECELKFLIADLAKLYLSEIYGLCQKDFSKGWHLCQLEVLDCMKVAWLNSVTEEKYCVEDCGWPLKKFAYECKINLLTGRTHQIRAQLAACGAPIVGDSMYMPAAIAEMISPGLNPFGKYKKQCTSEYDKAMAMQEWISHHGKEPSVAIGLQACQISWDDGEHFYEARSPWWR
ncbi:hypothetical protein CsSME_00030790 [Camellia sinensis var. sinensis]